MHRARPAVARLSVSDERAAVPRTLVGLGLAIALAVAGLVLAAAGGRADGAASPDGTVRDFLVTAAIDNDSVDACQYLTPKALLALRRVTPRDTTCNEALAASGLELGGEPVTTEGQVKNLGYRVSHSGDRATVTITRSGAARTFGLRRATGAERRDADAPATPWRIDSGVDQLVRS
jgi:hypothetical protein